MIRGQESARVFGGAGRSLLSIKEAISIYILYTPIFQLYYSSNLLVDSSRPYSSNIIFPFPLFIIDSVMR